MSSSFLLHPSQGGTEFASRQKSRVSPTPELPGENPSFLKVDFS